MLARIMILALAIASVGCEMFPTPKQVLKSDTLYRADIVVGVNGVYDEGVFAANGAQRYEIHAIAAADLDMILVRTCHREWTKQKAWNVTQKVQTGWFGFTRTIEAKREIKFTYVPDPEIEAVGACPMEIRGFSQSGQNSWALVDFRTPLEELTFRLKCNGVSSVQKGVAACQARQGLYQKVSFDEETTVLPDESCSLGKTKGSEFEFRMPSGTCVYRFQSASGKVGRLTLVGYDGVLIRED